VEVKKKAGKKEALRTDRQIFSANYRNIHNDQSYESTPRHYRKKYDAARPFKGEFRNGHALLTAAMNNVWKVS
jgi:hypothetical protein